VLAGSRRGSVGKEGLGGTGIADIHFSTLPNGFINRNNNNKALYHGLRTIATSSLVKIYQRDVQQLLINCKIRVITSQMRIFHAAFGIKNQADGQLQSNDF
jgi:hypothetical protein